MRRAAGRVIALLALAAGIPACAPKANTPDSDARAIAIADGVIDSLGGRARWDRLAGLRWTFESAVGDSLRPGRRHAWDKRTGWHRVEGRNRQGQSFVLIGRLGEEGAGMAWMDGTPITGDSLARLLGRAQSMWTNDTYWMLMPYKLRDPGVRLQYAGESREADRTYDRLALSFDRVGETPGDRYWVWVDRASHRVERWEYVLEGEQPPPEVWTWEGWENHAGLWFPTAHRRDSTVVYTRAIEVVDDFPDGTFERP